MDMTTMLKAIQIVGEATEAGKQLFEGFIAVTAGGDQAALQQRYAEARVRSDALHARVQGELH